YETLAVDNPRLVYASISGFGQSGPLATRPGFDQIAQGMGGLMAITGHADGEAGGGPQKVGLIVSDLMAGMYASVAILAALRHADRTGQGQHIDMALLDSVVAIGANQIIGYLNGGRVPPRYGNAHANVVPYNVFQTADGYMILAVGNDSQWRGCCRAIGRPDLEADERYRTMTGRIEHRKELLADLEAYLRTQPARHRTEALEREGVPCGPINDYAQVMEEPQVKHRGLQLELPRDDGGSAPSIASPLRLSGTPVRTDRAPPLLGHHTEEVLEELLGLDAEKVAKLREAGAI
ncbi:MAG: CaiB/BaiF CoA transferase family protein, partial [Gammaproteobacteria bacterium]